MSDGFKHLGVDEKVMSDVDKSRHLLQVVVSDGLKCLLKRKALKEIIRNSKTQEMKERSTQREER